jgi:hypothetical protein
LNGVFQAWMRQILDYLFISWGSALQLRHLMKC